MNEAVAASAVASRPWARAAAWLAFLGPFFFASYGFATWLTAQRSGVGAIVYDWERGIPFVPWTIVPYWSIDLLYGLSLFVCADRRELDNHARRLLTAQLVAVACFLAFPLRFTFDRPAADGAFGWLFRVLAGFDQPFNQAPSLHIALLVILWSLYGGRLGAAGRLLLHAWFALIGISVLTTWQHHFVDVPTGALLGFFCLWLWPHSSRSPLAGSAWTRDPQRWRIAGGYALGGLALAAPALALGGAWAWLAWAAVALALVALCYARLGPAGFEKSDGALAPAALVLFAPYVAAAWLNARLWTRRHPNPDCVAEDVWLGRMPAAADLARGGFAAVVDLTCELPCAGRGVAYTNVPVLDLTVPAARTLATAATAIEHRRAQGRVLVCCALGYSRSAAAVAAWLLATGRAPDAAAAIERVRAVRAPVVLTDAHRAAIAAAVAK